MSEMQPPVVRVSDVMPHLVIEIGLEGTPRIVVQASSVEDEQRLLLWSERARDRICAVVADALGASV